MQSYRIGFDIGGTNARSALLRMEENGEIAIVAKNKNRIRSLRTPEDLVAVIDETVRDYIDRYGIDASSIKNIGIAMAGQIGRDERTMVNAPNLGYRNVPIADMIEDSFRQSGIAAEVAIVNDLNAIVWGEHCFGAVKGIKNVLAVYVGTGIGSGVVADGRLLKGASNVSGEIGHIKIPGNIETCGCGQSGCIEALFGGKAIERRLEEAIAAGRVTRDTLGLAADEKATAACIEKSMEHSAFARDFAEDFARSLAYAVSNACMILNPEALLLGGGVLEGCSRLKTKVKEYIEPLLLAVTADALSFRNPTLGDDAGVLGAALLSLDV